MKLVTRTILLAVAIAPAFALAGQSGGGLTREEVRAQLMQVEQAGYNPARKDVHYPQSIQAAQARGRSSEATSQADTSGYGSAQSVGGDSGAAVPGQAALRRSYAHH